MTEGENSNQRAISAKTALSPEMGQTENCNWILQNRQNIVFGDFYLVAKSSTTMFVFFKNGCSIK